MTAVGEANIPLRHGAYKRTGRSVVVHLIAATTDGTGKFRSPALCGKFIQWDVGVEDDDLLCPRAPLDHAAARPLLTDLVEAAETFIEEADPSDFTDDCLIVRRSDVRRLHETLARLADATGTER